MHSGFDDRQDDRRSLTVHLDRVGDELLARYFRPEHGLVSSPPPRAFATLGADLRFGEACGVLAVSALLDRGTDAELRRELTGSRRARLGRLLFALLFGDAPQWQPILRGLFDIRDAHAAVSPIQHPVRLRIATTDPVLLGLPWRLTTFQDKYLLDEGWTFEVCPADLDPHAGNPTILLFPGRLLVVAPEPKDKDLAALDTARHVATLREALTARSRYFESDDCFHVVRTRVEVLDALAGRSADIVYYFGHAVVREEEVALALGAAGQPADYLSVADLRPAMRRSPVKIVYLNGCLTGAAGWQSAGHQLCGDVPVVLANRTSAYSGYAGAFAQRLLEAWLCDGADPTVALHDLAVDFRRDDFQWATHTLHTAYQSWSATAGAHRVRHPHAALRVDRDAPRALVDKHVRELVRRGGVEAIMAFAAPGNLVERFSGQALDYIEHQQHRVARLRRQILTFPAEYDVLQKRLLDQLRSQLGAAPGETTEHLLARSAPKAGRLPGRPVLWLEWNCFDPSRGGKRLTITEVVEWLRFSSQLEQHCPVDLCVVSYLGVEVESDKYENIGNRVEEESIDLESERFRATLLPPLAAIKLIDLVRFLTDPDNTTCPPGLAREAARLIYRRTGGEYEATVRLIDRGKQITWSKLLDEMRAARDHTLPARGEKDDTQ